MITQCTESEEFLKSEYLDEKVWLPRDTTEIDLPPHYDDYVVTSIIWYPGITHIDPSMTELNLGFAHFPCNKVWVRYVLVLTSVNIPGGRQLLMDCCKFLSCHKKKRSRRPQVSTKKKRRKTVAMRRRLIDSDSDSDGDTADDDDVDSGEGDGDGDEGDDVTDDGDVNCGGSSATETKRVSNRRNVISEESDEAEITDVAITRIRHEPKSNNISQSNFIVIRNSKKKNQQIGILPLVPQLSNPDGEWRDSNGEVHEVECATEDCPVRIAIRSNTNKLPSQVELKDWESLLSNNQDLRFSIAIRSDFMRKMARARGLKVKGDGLCGYRCLRMLMEYDMSNKDVPADLDFADKSDRSIFMDWLNVTVNCAEERRASQIISPIAFDSRGQLVTQLRNLIRLLAESDLTDDNFFVVKDHWLRAPDIIYIIEARKPSNSIACFDVVLGDNVHLSVWDTLNATSMTGNQVLSLLSKPVLLMANTSNHYFPLEPHFPLKQYFETAIQHYNLIKHKFILKELLENAKNDDKAIERCIVFNPGEESEDSITEETISPTTTLLANYPSEKTSVRDHCNILFPIFYYFVLQ